MPTARWKVIRRELILASGNPTAVLILSKKRSTAFAI